MKLASNMKLIGVRPELVLVAIVVESIYARRGLDPVIVSVVRDPNPNSLHDEGMALDVRLPSACERFIPSEASGRFLDDVILLELRVALGAHCDVVDERKPLRDPPPPGWGPHFHIEVDPRAPARR